MNYIQRLFDAAAPSAPRTVAVPVAGAGMGSPIIGTDQRLGMFPDLADPFATPVGEPIARTPDQGNGPVARDQGAEPPVGATAPRPAKTPSPRPEAATPADSGASDASIDTTPARRTSPLQRLAESAPLDPPVRRARDPAEPGRAAPATASIDAGSIATLAPAPDPGLPAARSERPASVLPAEQPLAAPFRVTADQFQPSALAAPPPIRAAANDAAHEPAALLQPRQDLPPTPPPLQPLARDAESPLARYAEALPPPPVQAPSPAPATPERVVERIREVSVAPPAPPPAMTAAGQSVIGSLGQRGSHGWLPRQEGF